LSEELSNYFRKLIALETNRLNLVFKELKVRRFADIQEEICCRAVWRWAILGLSYEDMQ